MCMFSYSKYIFKKHDHHIIFEKTLLCVHNIDFDGFKDYQSSAL
jgi:hypothetical protein